MRKSFVALIVTGLTLTAGSGVALAAGGDIGPTTYSLPTANTDVWAEYNQGVAVQSGGLTVYFNGSTTSAHKYGTWNSPYTMGIDGYNYNDPQSYTSVGDQADSDSDGIADIFSAGPHGGYLTTTHRCRECHAVHRAAGKFKLLRSDTRFEACDWCHGFGAGSGFNIQMDNDDNVTTEYNVGHTLGFGIQTGKWRAPDDTFPAYTPNYWLGGFSCFDCHSPHANPARMLGFDGLGDPVGEETQTTINGVTMTRVFGIANPGHDILPGDPTHISTGPVYLSGSWLLVKDPDRETAGANTTVASGITGDPDITVTAGAEISDAITAGLNEFDTTTPYPVNKIATDWNSPIGAASTSDTSIGYNQRNMSASARVWNVSEFCTDCHDGNAGLHTIQSPLFSEDRALRDQGHSTDTPEWKGNYDLAYGHDAQPRH